MRQPSGFVCSGLAVSMLAFALSACSSERPTTDAVATATAASSGKPAAVASATVSAATPSASASAPAAPSAALPKVDRPKSVTSCDPAPAHYGGFTPTLDDLVAAGKALGADVCIPRAELEQAIRACASETGKTELSIFADAGESTGCHVTIQGGKEGDRRWVVFVGTFRRGPVFDAGATAVELGATPQVYVDSLGKHAELCPMTSSTGKPPADLPRGWTELPAGAKDFLCSGVIADAPAEP